MDNQLWDLLIDTVDTTPLDLHSSDSLTEQFYAPDPGQGYDADWGDWSVLESWARYTPSLSPAKNIAGDAWNDRHWWNYQGQQNSCAIVAQQGVVESIIGQDLSSEKLISLSVENGWYDPAVGTHPDDVGNILDKFNIPYQRGNGYEFTDIYTALESGQKVIVGLDANEIWQPQEAANGDPIEQQDCGHAVWVTGVVAREGEVFVVLNDSGTATGWQNEVELKHFLNAWDDYSNFAVITEIDPAAHNLSATQQYNGTA